MNRFFLLLLFSFACSDTPENGEPELPAAQPVMIGEGVVSTELPEFATSFSPDGQTVYYNQTTADRSSMRIMASTLQSDGSWSAPNPLPFSDGTFFDVDPFVTSDGSRIYFTSNRPLTGAEPKDLDSWYVERQGDGWSDPINPGSPLNGPGDEIFVSLTKDQTVYFSILTDSTGSFFRSVFTSDGYQDPEPVNLGLPDSIRVGNPLVDPDEEFLIFASRQLGGHGNADLFIADRLEDGSFGPIRNIGDAVNSEYADFAPGLSHDKSTLYFTSERPGVVGTLEEGRPPSDLYEVSLDAVLNAISE